MRDSSFIVNSAGDTCEDLKNYAYGIEQVSNKCAEINYNFRVQCCPEDFDDPCVFCPAGLTVDPSISVPNSGGYDCGGLLDASRGINDSTGEVCTGLKLAEPLCCPGPDSASAQGGICHFCPKGLSDETKDEPAPDAQGATCNEVAFFYATGFTPDSDECTWLVQLESFCCPGDSGEPGLNAEPSGSTETTGEDDGSETETDTSEAESAATTADAQGEENEVPAEKSSRTCGFCGIGGVSPDIAGTEVPQSGGLTCSDLFGYAQTFEDGADECDAIALAEPFCCPGAAAAKQSLGADETSSKVCDFCGVGGVSLDLAGTEVWDGFSCLDILSYAQTFEDGADECDAIVLAEQLCCPGAAAAQQSLGADGEN